MTKLLTRGALPVLLACALAIASVNARADVSMVDQGAFPPGSLRLDFSAVPDGTELNGATFGGLTFAYSLGSGIVKVMSSGPGPTNNISVPMILSQGNTRGVLSVLLPVPASLFGYGWAVLDTSPHADATTIALFNGAMQVGALSYDGLPDPMFAGGFAGIQSTLPFDRVTLTFSNVIAFAVDNVSVSAVPETGSAALMAAGVGALLLIRRRLVLPW